MAYVDAEIMVHASYSQNSIIRDHWVGTPTFSAWVRLFAKLLPHKLLDGITFAWSTMSYMWRSHGAYDLAKLPKP